MTGPPLYSIGAVARMVDVPAATLRTWEERYGLPLPERSPGGHRLYSRDQVEQLRFVKAKLGEGMAPADAHRLLGHLPEQELGPKAAEAVALLALVAGQDVEPADGVHARNATAARRFVFAFRCTFDIPATVARDQDRWFHKLSFLCCAVTSVLRSEDSTGTPVAHGRQ